MLDNMPPLSANWTLEPMCAGAGVARCLVRDQGRILGTVDFKARKHDEPGWPYRWVPERFNPIDQ